MSKSLSLSTKPKHTGGHTMDDAGTRALTNTLIGFACAGAAVAFAMFIIVPALMAYGMRSGQAADISVLIAVPAAFIAWLALRRKG